MISFALLNPDACGDLEKTVDDATWPPDVATTAATAAPDQFPGSHNVVCGG